MKKRGIILDVKWTGLYAEDPHTKERFLGKCGQCHKNLTDSPIRVTLFRKGDVFVHDGCYQSFRKQFQVDTWAMVFGA